MSDAYTKTEVCYQGKTELFTVNLIGDQETVIVQRETAPDGAVRWTVDESDGNYVANVSNTYVRAALEALPEAEIQGGIMKLEPKDLVSDIIVKPGPKDLMVNVLGGIICGVVLWAAVGYIFSDWDTEWFWTFWRTGVVVGLLHQFGEFFLSVFYRF